MECVSHTLITLLFSFFSSLNSWMLFLLHIPFQSHSFYCQCNNLDFETLENLSGASHEKWEKYVQVMVRIYSPNVANRGHGGYQSSHKWLLMTQVKFVILCLLSHYMNSFPLFLCDQPIRWHHKALHSSQPSVIWFPVDCLWSPPGSSGGVWLSEVMSGQRHCQAGWCYMEEWLRNLFLCGE